MTWQTIKIVINNPCTEKIIRSNFVNNIECTDDNRFPEAFGKYFSEITDNLETKIPRTKFDPLSIVNQIIFIPYLPSIVKKIIKSLKNTKTDTYTLPVIFLKIHTDIFSPVRANLTNEIFT